MTRRFYTEIDLSALGAASKGIIGPLTISGGAVTFTGGKTTLTASTTGGGALNIPSGTDPTTYVVGDIWWNSTSLKASTTTSSGGVKTFAFIDSTLTGLWNGTAISAQYGGTGQSGTNPFTTGGVTYASSQTALAQTAAGIAGQVLLSGGASGPSWTAGTLSLPSSSSLTLFGGYGLTLTSTATTNATLPSGTNTLAANVTTTIGDLIYASATGTPGTLARLAGNTTSTINFLSQTGTGTTSAAPAWTSSTGTGNVVLATSPTFGTSVIGGSSMDVFNTSSGTLNIANAAGTINFGNVVGNSTVNIANGLLNSGNTRQIYIGANSASGATTQVQIGSSLGTSTNSIYGATTFGGTVTLNSDPTLALQAATKQYVDNIATGVNAHDAVAYATTGSNIPGTYLNGTSGVGATLTGTGSLTIDSYTFTSTDVSSATRVLLKDQTLLDQNGIYVVTAISAGTSWTLTRAVDYNSTPNVSAGDFMYVLNGPINGKFSFVQTSKPGGISGNGTSGNNITFSVFSNGNLTSTVTPSQGGTGTAGTITGIGYFNATSNMTAASGTQVATALGTTAVTNANNANVTETTTNATYYPVFSPSTTTGFKALNQNSGTNVLSYNPSTGTLATTTFSGSGASLTNLTAGNLSGTIPSGVLGNSSLYIGTTSIALNRASASLALTGISAITGAASTNFTIQATSSNTTPGYDLVLTGGDASGASAGTGGKVTIAGGPGNASTGYGGTVYITGGTGSTGNPGGISIGATTTSQIVLGAASPNVPIYINSLIPSSGTGYLKIAASTGQVSQGTIAYADLPVSQSTPTSSASAPAGNVTSARKVIGAGLGTSAQSIVVNHGLGQWVHAQLFEISTGNLVEVDIVNSATSGGTTTFTFASATTNLTSYQYVIVG